jgi:multidrug efflux pump subunit AcrA (membrane-fusion protein)
MTYVGKILVLLIMAMSLVFLGVSVTAFVTATNWKEATAKKDADLKKVQGQLATRDSEKKDAEAKLQTAQAELAATTKKYEDQLNNLRTEATNAQAEKTQLQTALTDANTNSSLATAESQARTAEMTKLRDQLSASVDMGNKLKIEQTEKNVQILTLQRQLEASDRSAKDLRENLARAMTRLRQLGDSLDLRKVASSGEIPADVEGKVLKVDAKNRSIEISIGSDDGVSTGMELYLFRTSPQPEYLGKVKVGLVEGDQSVATVIGNTVHGKKIMEGDNVSSTLRSH